ncbi:MAG: hypothetical protein AB8B59_07860 [Maribacter sp.]
MTKTIIFNQRSQKKSTILFASYLLFLLVVGIFVGGGAFGILDFINSFQRVTIPAIIMGVVLLAPIFLLVKLAKHKITIQINPDTIKVSDGKVVELDASKIKKITINEPRANTVNLYTENELFYCFDTGDGEESLKELTHLIVEYVGKFEKSERKRKVAKGEIDVIEYVKVK